MTWKRGGGWWNLKQQQQNPKTQQPTKKPPTQTTARKPTRLTTEFIQGKVLMIHKWLLSCQSFYLACCACSAAHHLLLIITSYKSNVRRLAVRHGACTGLMDTLGKKIFFKRLFLDELLWTWHCCELIFLLRKTLVDAFKQIKSWLYTTIVVSSTISKNTMMGSYHLINQNSLLGNKYFS